MNKRQLLHDDFLFCSENGTGNKHTNGHPVLKEALSLVVPPNTLELRPSDSAFDPSDIRKGFFEFFYGVNTGTVQKDNGEACQRIHVVPRAWPTERLEPHKAGLSDHNKRTVLTSFRYTPALVSSCAVSELQKT